jgi:hypothetical protein
MAKQKKSKDTLSAKKISESKLASGLVNLKKKMDSIARGKSTNNINFSTKDINAIVNKRYNSSMAKSFKKQKRKLDSMAKLKK